MALSTMPAADLPDNDEVLAVYYKARSIVTPVNRNGDKSIDDFYVDTRDADSRDSI